MTQHSLYAQTCTPTRHKSQMRDSLSRKQAMRQAVHQDHHHAPLGYEDQRDHHSTHALTGTAPFVASSMRIATGSDGILRPCISACIVLTDTPISRANALDALP